VAATMPELVVVDIGSQRSAELGRALVTDRSGSLAGVPVILTTPAGEVSRELLSHAGPDVHHLPKPFTAQALEELVQVLLRRR
jgi:DNA-binding response OmpR family regulator